jgi:hypothetical protein
LSAEADPNPARKTHERVLIWKNDTKERERGVASSSTGLYS